MADSVELNLEAGILDIVVEQGALIDIPLGCYDESDEVVHLSSYTARMQLRPAPGDETLILELTTENGGIILDDVDPNIRLVITGEQSAEIASPATYKYDFELVDADGEPFKPLKGKFKFKAEVTV